MLNKGRRTLLLIAAICALPIIASYVLYMGWRPEGRMNYGELLETRLLPVAILSDLAGKSIATDSLRGKWWLVTIQSPSCDPRCQRKLYTMRQVRTTQGENMERIERLWLINGDGAPDPKLLAEHPGLLVGRPQDPAWLAAFPVKDKASDHIYLIDPLGNLVLRYGDEVDPKGMIKDLTRLLKVSQIG
jgi:hypothetical protein